METTTSKSRDIVLKGSSMRKVPYYLGWLLVALVLVWLAVKVGRSYVAYRTMAPHLAGLQVLASHGAANPAALDLAQLEDDLDGLATGLETLSQELGPFMPLTAYLGWVPTYGADIQAAPYLLAAGRDLSRAGAILVARFAPVLEGTPAEGQTALIPRLIKTLAQSEAEVGQATMLLRQAQANLEAVDSDRLSPGVGSRVALLQETLPLATSGLGMAGLLPDLLGMDSPRTYLILSQNADEARPTGGYISAAGHVTVEQGQIVELVLGDSYGVDRISAEYPYPPDPIYQYMAADYWLLRDANWSPDFPTTARTALKLYEMGRGVSADGVIALDQYSLPLLLPALEPLEVDGERVTGKNVIALIRQKWGPEAGQELDADWWRQRKSFMVSLAQAMQGRFEGDPGSMNLPLLARALQQALAEKHLLVYLADPQAAAFLAKQNWSGSLQTAPGDYLMVVDANLGFNKASAAVERQLTYEIALADDGGAQAHANLVYRHAGHSRSEQCWQEPRYDPVYEQNMDRCYWNYLRLVVPAGARLRSGPAVVVPGEYLLRGQPTSGEIDVEPLGPDKVSWGQLFLLAPQESLSLDYVYTLPAGSARRVDGRWQYSLYLQKQPGTDSPPAEVAITLPEGARLLDSHPQPQRRQGRTVAYSIEMETDQAISISYALP